MNPTIKLVRRYGLATIGLFLVALGVALSLISNLGCAPLSSTAYVFNLKWPGISVGVFTQIVNFTMIFVQLAVLGRKFKAEHLMQIVASFLFGYMIDGCMWALSWLTPAHYADRIALIVLAGLVTALGASIEVESKAWMLSAEMTVSAFSTRLGTDFGKTKVVMDSTMVVISAVCCVIFFANPFGASPFSSIADVLFARNPGIVIGLGTLIMAFLPGWFMRFTNKPVQTWFAKRKELLF